MACSLFGAKPLPEPVITIGNTVQLNAKWSMNIFIQEIKTNNVIYNISANLLRAEFVNRHELCKTQHIETWTKTFCGHFQIDFLTPKGPIKKKST